MTSTSFTFKANTTYLVFAFVDSAAGDSVTFSSTGLGSPTFNLIGSGSLNFNTTDYEYGRYLNGGNNASGTITVTTVKKIGQAYLQIVELCGNDTSAPITTNVAYLSGNTTPATANLPAGPIAGTNFDVYFLDGEDFGTTAPVGTPAATNLLYQHGGGDSAGTYFKTTPTQNESFALGTNKHWGTIGVEIKRP
jgi:hypothetical protein